MYNSRTEQLPQSTSHHHTSFSSLSSEQKLHPPTSALPSEKRRRSIKKKLSFSQASKEGSTKWQSPSNAEKQNISRPNMDADFGTLDTVSCKNIPQVVMVGVVKQMDLPLSFLCPTSSCSCSSICVPRSVRTQYSLPVLTVATPSLFKLPFTPPSQLSKRKKHWGLRKRSKSAPLVSSGVDVCSLMNLSLTVDVKRCVSIKDKPGSHSPPQRSVSMSPRYPVLRLKDVLEAQKITKSLPQPQVELAHMVSSCHISMYSIYISPDPSSQRLPGRQAIPLQTVPNLVHVAGKERLPFGELHVTIPVNSFQG